MSHDDPTPDDAFRDVLNRYQGAVESNDPAKVESAVHGLFAVAEEWCEQNPSPDRELSTAANDCAERGDWAGAEALYHQLLALPDLQSATQYRAHSELAGLYRMLNRNEDALAANALATAAARRTDIPILLLMALVAQANLLISEGRFDDSVPPISEALSLTADDQAFGQLRARALTARARCAIHAIDLVAAECDLDQAFDLLQPMANIEMAAGVHRDLARCWSARASLYEARQDWRSAVDAWQRAVALSRQVAALPQCATVYTQAAVAHMLHGLASALGKAGRNSEAEAANAEKASILRNANLK